MIFRGSRSKTLVAFLRLPKEVIIPQEATDWLPTLLQKLGPLSGCPLPNTGAPPVLKGNHRFKKLYRKLLEQVAIYKHSWVTCPSHLPGSLCPPPPTPKKEQNLDLVNDCSFEAENPFKSRSPKARMSQQPSEISRTPIVKKNNRPGPFICAKSLLISGQAKLQAASPWNTNTQTGLSHSPA